MFLMFLFVVTIGRYFILQVIQHDEMEEKIMNIARDNVVRQSPRGKILDRNGRELAISRIAKLLVIRPDKVGSEEDIQVLSAELSPIINIPAETVPTAYVRAVPTMPLSMDWKVMRKRQ